MTRGEDNAIQFYINGQLDSHHTPEEGFNDPHFQHILTFGARTQGIGTYQDWFSGTLDVRHCTNWLMCIDINCHAFSYLISLRIMGHVWLENRTFVSSVQKLVLLQ